MKDRKFGLTLMITGIIILIIGLIIAFKVSILPGVPTTAAGFVIAFASLFTEG